jgi:hypothetical protein
MMAAITRYAPLLALVLVAGCGAFALARSGMAPMQGFMGLALLLFALLKFMNLPGFVKGFRRYDLLAQTVPPYAWVYPAFELALGTAYLAGYHPHAINSLMLALSLMNLASVGSAVEKGLNVNCACLGTALNVPLTTVSVVEYGTMAAMAGWMLLA